MAETLGSVDPVDPEGVSVLRAAHASDTPADPQTRRKVTAAEPGGLIRPNGKGPGSPPAPPRATRSGTVEKEGGAGAEGEWGAVTKYTPQNDRRPALIMLRDVWHCETWGGGGEGAEPQKGGLQKLWPLPKRLRRDDACWPFSVGLLHSAGPPSIVHCSCARLVLLPLQRFVLRDCSALPQGIRSPAGARPHMPRGCGTCRGLVPPRRALRTLRLRG